MIDGINNIINQMYETIFDLPNLFKNDEIPYTNSIENYNNYNPKTQPNNNTLKIVSYDDNDVTNKKTKQSYSEHYKNYNHQNYYYDTYNNYESYQNNIHKKTKIAKPQNMIVMQTVPKTFNNKITIDFFECKNNSYGQFVDISEIE